MSVVYNPNNEMKLTEAQWEWHNKALASVIAARMVHDRADVMRRQLVREQHKASVLAFVEQRMIIRASRRQLVIELNRRRVKEARTSAVQAARAKTTSTLESALRDLCLHTQTQ